MNSSEKKGKMREKKNSQGNTEAANVRPLITHCLLPHFLAWTVYIELLIERVGYMEGLVFEPEETGSWLCPMENASE